MGDLNARTGKYSDSVCKAGNNLITNDQSEFSLCPTQRLSFNNELNSRLKRYELRKLADKNHQDPLNTISNVSNTMILWPNTRNYLILNRMIITMCRFLSQKKLETIQTRKLSGNASNRQTTLEKERMFYQSGKKIGYNISTIFIQMNLLTQRSKTFAMSRNDKMNAMVNTLVLQIS